MPEITNATTLNPALPLSAPMPSPSDDDLLDTQGLSIHERVVIALAKSYEEMQKSKKDDSLAIIEQQLNQAMPSNFEDAQQYWTILQQAFQKEAGSANSALYEQLVQYSSSQLNLYVNNSQLNEEEQDLINEEAKLKNDQAQLAKLKDQIAQCNKVLEALEYAGVFVGVTSILHKLFGDAGIFAGIEALENGTVAHDESNVTGNQKAIDTIKQKIVDKSRNFSDQTDTQATLDINATQQNLNTQKVMAEQFDAYDKTINNLFSSNKI